MITLEKVKEIIGGRAKDLGLSYNTDDIKVIQSGEATIVWLSKFDGVDNIDAVLQEDEEFIVYPHFQTLVFLLWDGLVHDKVFSFSVSELS